MGTGGGNPIRADDITFTTDDHDEDDDDDGSCIGTGQKRENLERKQKPDSVRLSDCGYPASFILLVEGSLRETGSSLMGS